MMLVHKGFHLTRGIKPQSYRGSKIKSVDLVHK